MGQIASLRRRTNVPNITNGIDNDDENCEMHRFSSHPGAFFGSYFLLGGERYDLAKPEAFLFGENADLDILGNRSVQFPYSSQPVNDPVRTLNALINLRRDSLKLTKSKNDASENNKNSFYLEFYFDCDSACYVQIHFFAKEFVNDGRIQFVHKYPQLKSSEQYYFDIGAEQHFNKFVMDPAVYDLSSMHYESGSYFPVVIEIRAVDCGIEQMQSTMASIEHATDQCATFVVKALKQKLVADGVVYLLQEIYGIENKEHDLGDENGSECIICMSDIRDTVILPCRHLCICNGCAETLRYKLNNCPICRSPFRALLQLKTMRVVSTVSVTDQSPSSQQTRSQTRYETMTLVEALNGPISHIQSCVVPTAPLGYNIDSPHEISASLNSKITRRSSRSSVAIQQVLMLNNQGRNKKDNTVCIEMKSANEFKNEEEMSNGCSTSRCPDSPSDITYSSVSSHSRRYKKQQTMSPQYNRKKSIENPTAQENAPIELAKNSNDIAAAQDL
ncbi:unnamed protein product [Onchocerca ochengi]|uniref:RING-type E3 ubiquitin transferase n=1 Tax=Onchocerca ochengi TaxID=42157 RepID=A0A182ECH0_ONCOC|nr:unnamed protein product [Onchocerca ochengi]